MSKTKSWLLDHEANSRTDERAEEEKMKKRVKGKPTEQKPEVADEEDTEVAPEIQELAEWAEKITEDEEPQTHPYDGGLGGRRAGE